MYEKYKLNSGRKYSQWLRNMDNKAKLLKERA